MYIIESFKCPSEYYGRIGLTIGNFEGFHLGHAKILNYLKGESDKHDLFSAVMTFKNHPLEVLRGFSPKRLWARCDKIKTFCDIGINLLIYLNFDKSFASMEPEIFLEILVKSFKPRFICLGESFRFGKDNKGDLNYIKKVSKIYEFELISVKEYVIDGVKVSSTLIRDMIKNGDIHNANRFLGKNYQIYLRRTSGITNLMVENMAIPHSGLYKGELFDLNSKEYYDSEIKISNEKVEFLKTKRENIDGYFAFKFI